MANLQFSFAALLIAGGVLLACLTVFVWRRRSVESGAELAVVLAAATIWVLGGAAEHLSTAHWYDISAAKRDLGYTAEISIAEALELLAASLKS